MTMQHEDVSLALIIKDKNPEIDAPVNDIIACISEVREAGVSDGQLRKMVSNMFLSDSSSRYANTSRQPCENEILVYDLDTKWCSLMENPV